MTISLEEFAFSLALAGYTHEEIGKMIGKSPEWVCEAAQRFYEKIARAELDGADSEWEIK